MIGNIIGAAGGAVTRTITNYIIYGLIIVVLLFGTTFYFYFDYSQNKMDEMKEKQAQLEGAVNTAQEQTKNVANDLSLEKRKFETYQAMVVDQQRRLYTLEQDIETNRLQLQSLKASVTTEMLRDRALNDATFESEVNKRSNEIIDKLKFGTRKQFKGTQQ